MCLINQRSRIIYWGEGHALQVCLDQCSAVQEEMIMSFSISIHPVSKPLTRSLKQRQHNSPRQHVLIDSYLTEPAWGKRSEHESTVVDGAHVCSYYAHVLVPPNIPFNHMCCSPDDRRSISTGMVLR
jgi:hypothetical protein